MKKLLFLFAIVLLSFASCQKETLIDKTDDKKPEPKELTSNPLISELTAKTTTGNGLFLGCFSIDYIFSISVNGTELEITSEQDFENAMNVDPLDSIYFDFVFPFNITFEDGTTSSITSEDELGEAFASCIPDEGWGAPGFPAYLIDMENSCYNLVYPIQLEGVDGTYTLNTEEEFINQLATANDYLFIFPLELVNIDGEIFSASNEEELFGLLLNCCPGGGIDTTFPGNPIDSTFYGGLGTIACFDIVYPMNYKDAQGNVSVANDIDELITFILNGDFIEISFPITLVEPNSPQITVNSESELMEAIKTCPGFPTVLDMDLNMLYYFSNLLNPMDSTAQGCYTILYPITINKDGISSTIVNETEIIEELANDEDAILEFPVTVTKILDGQSVIFTTIDDLYIWIENCN